MNKAAHNAVAIFECFTCSTPLSPQRIRAQKSHCALCEPRQASCEQVVMINPHGMRRAVVVRRP